MHLFYYLQNPVELIESPFVLVGGALWIWMLVHCARNDPERNLWLWILLIGNAPAVQLVADNHDFGTPQSSGNVAHVTVQPGGDVQFA